MGDADVEDDLGKTGAVTVAERPCGLTKGGDATSAAEASAPRRKCVGKKKTGKRQQGPSPDPQLQRAEGLVLVGCHNQRKLEETQPEREAVDDLDALLAAIGQADGNQIRLLQS